MHNTEGNRIAYILAMATSLSGFAAQGLLRVWGFEGAGDLVLMCTLLYTLFVHAAVLMVWQPGTERKHQYQNGAHRYAASPVLKSKM